VITKIKKKLFLELDNFSCTLLQETKWKGKTQVEVLIS